MTDAPWVDNVVGGLPGLLGLLGGLLAASVAVARIPRLDSAIRSDAERDLLVVIPARDEAHHLGHLLGDLAAQTVGARRVVVVDDGSEDGTAAIAADWCGRLDGLELRTAPPVPHGWNPKSAALCAGVAGATEHWLLFLDADVRLHPDALAAVLAVAATDGGVSSVAPRHDIGRRVEALSAVPNVVALMGAGGRVAHAAFGPCLLVSRSAYDSVGGHAAIGADLLDDVALAGRLRGAGRSVTVHRGGDLVRYRMYPTGVRTIVDGWSKNLAAGAARVPLGRALLAAWWITALLLPLWWLLQADRRAEVVAAAVAWAVVAAHSALLLRAVGRFGVLSAVLAPLLAVLFVVIVARSTVLLVARRPVRWKGRPLVAARPGGGPR